MNVQAVNLRGVLQKCTISARRRSILRAEARERIIVGIESSCDDTGVAVVTSSGRILGESIAHQHEIHAEWGGVVPTLAMEAHRSAIDRVFDEALNQVRHESHCMNHSPLYRGLTHSSQFSSDLCFERASTL